nr:MAG TPA: hypothetical protein [Caudoviricetes sp.]
MLLLLFLYPYIICLVITICKVTTILHLIYIISKHYM